MLHYVVNAQKTVVMSDCYLDGYNAVEMYDNATYRYCIYGAHDRVQMAPRNLAYRASVI